MNGASARPRGAPMFYPRILTMAWALRTGLTFCTTGGKTIFLDVLEDRYFCLAADADAAFQKLVGIAEASGIGMTLAHAPILAPLFQDCVDEALPAACRLEEAPMGSILDTGVPGSRIPMAVLAAKCIIQTSVMMRYRPFSTYVHAVQACKVRLSQKSSPLSRCELGPVAAAFERVRRFTTGHDSCLCRSVAMATMLLDRNMSVDLVFGVTARPFSAHCWVQHRGVVLNDTLDHVRNYTPILVI